jgi:hypothetical protein
MIQDTLLHLLNILAQKFDYVNYLAILGVNFPRWKIPREFPAPETPPAHFRHNALQFLLNRTY